MFDDTSGQTKIRVDRLSLKLTYTYRADKDATARAIRVTYSGTDAAPYFYVSARDDRQLQHAVGSFSRIYQGAQPVEIIAPATVSGARFDGWYVLGQRVEASSHLPIPPAGNSYFYEARYRR